MHQLRIGFAFALCASLISLAVSARAQTITISGLYATGVSNNGHSISGNKQDSHYVITATDAGSYTGSPYTAKNLAAGWMSNSSSSAWIVPPPSGTSTTRPAGYYDYTLTFTISVSGGVQASSAIITGYAAADDSAEIYVNGVLVNGVSISGAGSATGFTLDSSNANFVSGSNTLTFRVTNSVNNSSTGLMVTGLAGGNGPIPEVGSILPVIGAGAAYGISAWLRRRKRASQDSS